MRYGTGSSLFRDKPIRFRVNWYELPAGWRANFIGMATKTGIVAFGCLRTFLLPLRRRHRFLDSRPSWNAGSGCPAKRRVRERETIHAKTYHGFDTCLPGRRSGPRVLKRRHRRKSRVPDFVVVLGTSLLVILGVLLLPVLIPCAIISHTIEEKRKRAAAECFVCVKCGGVLGEESLRRSDSVWKREMEELQRENPDTRFRVVRVVHAICVSCEQEYSYYENKKTFVPYDHAPWEALRKARQEAETERCGQA